MENDRSTADESDLRSAEEVSPEVSSKVDRLVKFPCNWFSLVPNLWGYVIFHGMTWQIFRELSSKASTDEEYGYLLVCTLVTVLVLAVHILIKRIANIKAKAASAIKVILAGLGRRTKNLRIDMNHLIDDQKKLREELKDSLEDLKNYREDMQSYRDGLKSYREHIKSCQEDLKSYRGDMKDLINCLMKENDNLKIALKRN